MCSSNMQSSDKSFWNKRETSYWRILRRSAILHLYNILWYVQLTMHLLICNYVDLQICNLPQLSSCIVARLISIESINTIKVGTENIQIFSNPSIYLKKLQQDQNDIIKIRSAILSFNISITNFIQNCTNTHQFSPARSISKLPIKTALYATS